MYKNPEEKQRAEQGLPPLGVRQVTAQSIHEDSRPHGAVEVGVHLAKVAVVGTAKEVGNVVIRVVCGSVTMVVVAVALLVFGIPFELGITIGIGVGCAAVLLMALSSAKS